MASNLPHPRENRAYSDILTPNDTEDFLNDDAPVLDIPEVIQETRVIERTRSNASQMYHDSQSRFTEDELELVSSCPVNKM